MSTASIRDLRTQFPKVRKTMEEEGEVVVTEHGRPIAVLLPFRRPATRTTSVNYYDRLRGHSTRPLPAKARRELDEMNRGDR